MGFNVLVSITIGLAADTPAKSEAYNRISDADQSERYQQLPEPFVCLASAWPATEEEALNASDHCPWSEH